MIHSQKSANWSDSLDSSTLIRVSRKYFAESSCFLDTACVEMPICSQSAVGVQLELRGAGTTY